MRERATSLDAILPVLRIANAPDRHPDGFGPITNREKDDSTITEPLRRPRCRINSRQQSRLSRGLAATTVRNFHMTGRLFKRKHDVHGQNHNLSRLQVKAAGANSKKPAAARAVCDDGFPDSFRRAYSANQTWRLDFRSSAGHLAARQMELGRVRGAPSDDDQG